MRLDAARILHFSDMLMIGLEGDRIQRECRRLVFNLECSFIDPHGDLFSCESIFPKETPVSEADISMCIEVPRKLGGKQNTGEDLFRVRSSQHTAQDVVGAMPPVLACAMGEMMLDIVIGPPCLVLIQHLRPGACIGESVVSKPSLNVCYLEFGKFSNNLHYVDYERLPIEEFSENGGSIPHNGEQGLSIILPRLPRINAFLADTQHIIELDGLIAIENRPAVSHKSFWRPIAPKGVGQDRKVVPLVLRRRDSGSEYHAGKVLKHRNHIYGSGIWQQMLFDIPDITAPKFVAPCGFERHL